MAEAVRQIGSLDITYALETGQVLSVFDRSKDMTVIEFAPGHELEINERPLRTTLCSEDDPAYPAWQCTLRSSEYTSVGLGREFNIFRQLLVGSAYKPGGSHLNPPDSLHLRYRIERKQVDAYTTPDPVGAGRRPIQAPLWLDTIGALCAKTAWFGPDTTMIAAHSGACGPRSHVSFEAGPTAEVVPHLWNMFRRTHPGLQLIPGAMYTHPDGRWLWITCQRPTVGMHWDWNVDSQKAQFQYHARLQPAEIVHTPEVSLYWGRGGRDEMMRVLNLAFINYNEPDQDWWYHTCWHWFSFWGYRERGYDALADQAQYLHDTLGVTGFGLTTHDLRPGAWDCSPTGLRPSPHWGGEAAIRRFTQRVKAFGGHTYVWLPYMGLGKPGLDLKENWRLRGDDGRPYESFFLGNFDMYHAVNFGHPEVQAYYLDWIRRYIGDYGIDGIFWDCGGGPLPPDFTDPSLRPFQRFPSESMCAGSAFMEKVMQVGRACSDDFFMWHEGFSTDLPGHGYSTLTGNDEFICDLKRAGPNRLVFRSCSTYNLYGGFPAITPREDVGLGSPITIDTYKPVVEDRMNKWLVDFVRTNGCRDAMGIRQGVALCAGHLVVDPSSKPVTVRVPTWAGDIKGCAAVFGRKKLLPKTQDDDGVVFTLPGGMAYVIE